MDTVITNPSLSKLYSFIGNVRGYPISVHQLLGLAREKQVSKEVTEFYGAFDPDRTFKDRDDLTAATEQVEIMREESQDMPQEEFTASEED